MLTKKLNFCKKLLSGDVVLADRGFDISEIVAVNGGVLHILAFTKVKAQLSATEVHKTRESANVRIHVERVIGHVRQKFSILHGTLPFDYLQSHDDESLLLTRIGRTCCALSNLIESVVPFD